MCEILTVNDAKYTILRLLGKGKGGYSYLVTDGTKEYVLKQLHHEPSAYYTFGDKLHPHAGDGRPSAGAGARHVPPVVPGGMEHRLLSHKLHSIQRNALLYRL